MYDLEKSGLTVTEMVAHFEKGLQPAPGVALIYAPHTESAEQSKARWKTEHPDETLQGKRVVILRYAIEEVPAL
jgi:hypothetical protein